MTILDQNALALQMVAQLRVLDPSVSAEVGTPERKIIDTVAISLHDSQVDLDAISSGLDIDAKYGTQLDKFLNIFKFSRQQATFASGYITLSRINPATSDIRIPAGSTVQASSIIVSGDNQSVYSTPVQYTVIYDTILSTGQTSVTAAIRCNIAGQIGNVPSNSITQIIGTQIFGITSVNNDVPTRGGKDSESDEEAKVRFKNTLFRNLAGTQDQYMALAIATSFTTKANVIGPQSFYREYIQVPPVDDASSYDSNDDASPESGNDPFGQGHYTTALSTIPFAKYIYRDELPQYISNGDVGVLTTFYRSGIDWEFNSPPADKGDTYRQFITGIDNSAASSSLRPNVTFKNIYTGSDGAVDAVKPGDIILLEYSYLSKASRNNINLKLTNAVDVYIDGENRQLATTVIIRPTTDTAFIDDSNSKYYYEYYRRVGEPQKRPIIGNVFTPLFWEPILELPEYIIIDDTTYLQGIHYWVIEDISNLFGTTRARNGIEWSTTIPGRLATDISIDGPIDPSTFTGKIIVDPTGDPIEGLPIDITNYSYDKNIVDLQAALEGSRQITTDVLAHKAKHRYFKLDITVTYSSGSAQNDVNNQIQAAVDNYLRTLYFGANIQLSDLLQVIHNVSGVDNVRWTADQQNTNPVKIYEVDNNGVPLIGVSIDRIQAGTTSIAEVQNLYLTGVPTSGNFKLTYGINTTADIAWNASAGTIQTALSAISGIGSLTVAEEFRTNFDVDFPIRSFRVTWSSAGIRSILTYAPSDNFLYGGPFILNKDFFLNDDELSSLPESIVPNQFGTTDTAPGLIIRSRAQNTFSRGI